MADTSKTTTTVTLPSAVLKQRKRLSFVWLLPVAALLFAGGLMYRTWTMRGTQIQITFSDGHGLRQGDEVRYRGVVVGEIEEITLTKDAEGTIITASLLTHSNEIARQGALFWVVRPNIGPSGVSGLSTIVGPRWLAVRPGTGSPRNQFMGLDDQPVVETINEGDLEIILETDTRGSLQKGGPVNYRQFRVGTVLSVGLASDGSAVEARIHIQQAYVPLIREQSKFWDSGGVNLDVGLTGVSMDIDSLASVVIGSVSFATPPDAGNPVRTGYRFQLAPEPRSDWLRWQPNVPIGNALLPPGASVPSLERARLSWRYGIFQRRTSNNGWLLQVQDGLLGPANLLKKDEDAKEDTTRLEVTGKSLTIEAGDIIWESQGLALLKKSSTGKLWLKTQMRTVEDAEDCLIVASNAMTPIPLAQGRIEKRKGYWKIDEALSFDDTWHGACVLSREDGSLVGILLVTDGTGRVSLLTKDFINSN